MPRMWQALLRDLYYVLFCIMAIKKKYHGNKKEKYHGNKKEELQYDEYYDRIL